MIKNLFVVCLIIFSVTLNILMFVENQKLAERLRIETFKRMDEKFQRNHPQDQKIIPKYPIVVQLCNRID